MSRYSLVVAMACAIAVVVEPVHAALFDHENNEEDLDVLALRILSSNASNVSNPTGYTLAATHTATCTFASAVDPTAVCTVMNKADNKVKAKEALAGAYSVPAAAVDVKTTTCAAGTASRRQLATSTSIVATMPFEVTVTAADKDAVTAAIGLASNAATIGTAIKDLINADSDITAQVTGVAVVTSAVTATGKILTDAEKNVHTTTTTTTTTAAATTATTTTTKAPATSSAAGLQGLSMVMAAVATALLL